MIRLSISVLTLSVNFNLGCLYCWCTSSICSAQQAFNGVKSSNLQSMTLGPCMVRGAGCALVKGWSFFSHHWDSWITKWFTLFIAPGLTEQIWSRNFSFPGDPGTCIENHLLLSESHSLNSILTNAGVTPARGWAINCISLGLKHKPLSPSFSNLSTLFTASGPTLKAFYKHMTSIIYSN